MEHPLRTWLRAETDWTQNELAEEIGCTPSTLSDVLSGRYRFGRDKRLRVEELTGGRVTSLDLDKWEPDEAA